MAITTNFGTASNISPALRYGSNEKKLGCTLSVNCNKYNAIRDFNLPYKINNRQDDKVKLNRFVLSFANDKDDKSELNQHDSAEYVRDFMYKLSDRLNNNASMIAYEHTNTGHNHYHIYVNSLGLNGKKIKPKQSLLYMARDINDVVSNEYHLKPIDMYRQNATKQFTNGNRKRFSEKHNGYEPYSYYSDARQKISRAVLLSKNLDGFKQNMIAQNGNVEPNFFQNTKTGSVDINYRHKNWELEPNRLRKVRTRSLGADFEKSTIKRAINSPNYNKSLVKRYWTYAQDRDDVQGGKFSDSNVTKRIRQMDNLKGVQYNDVRLNSLAQIKGNSRRVANNSRKIESNSVKIRKQESDYRRRSPQITKNARASQPIISKPDLNGLSQIEREQVLADEKFFRALSNFVDGLLGSFQTISINKRKPNRHHSATRSSIKRELRQFNDKKKSDSKKQFSQFDNSKRNKSGLLPNERRKRYNKLHSNQIDRGRTWK